METPRQNEEVIDKGLVRKFLPYAVAGTIAALGAAGSFLEYASTTMNQAIWTKWRDSSFPFQRTAGWATNLIRNWVGNQNYNETHRAIALGAHALAWVTTGIATGYAIKKILDLHEDCIREGNELEQYQQ